MYKFLIFPLLCTCSLFSTEPSGPSVDLDALIDYLEFQCIQQQHYMENADSQEWHMFFKGKYLGYKDIKDFIEFRDLRN